MAFDGQRGLEGMSSVKPESGSIMLAQIGRLPEEIKGLFEQLRLADALPPFDNRRAPISSFLYCAQASSRPTALATPQPGTAGQNSR